MMPMSQAGLDAWDERSSEIIGVGEPWPKEKAEAYCRANPAPPEDEIWTFLEKYES